METRRCFWASGDEFYVRYHDEEWGLPVHDDKLLFEFLILEGFQAGLSWHCILNKRDNFRKAFDCFDPVKVSKYGPRKIQSLMEDSGIIRNRMKILAAMTNAHAFLKVQREFGTFDNYIWGFVKGESIINRWKTDREIPAKTKLAEKISKDLKSRGFKFVGPTVVYAHMQATGMVNDHLTTCFRWKECNAIPSQVPEEGLRPDLIAPCGINCGICSSYLAHSNGIPEERRKIHHCVGCRPRKRKCTRCHEHGMINKVRFCTECSLFPCEFSERLERRYMTAYPLKESPIGNLKKIKKHGMEQFLSTERKKWKCSSCGGLLCVHNGKCYKCQEIKSWRG